MSIAPWYLEWIADFCRDVRGRKDEGLENVLAAVAPVLLDERRASQRELADVTRRILRRAVSPQWPTDCRDAVFAELSAIRAEIREVESSARTLDCDTCGGTGLAIVPHPGWLDSRGCWYAIKGNPRHHPTLAVLCNCETGRQIQSRRDEAESFAESTRKRGSVAVPQPRQMSFVEYHAKHPSACTEMHRVRAVQRAERGGPRPFDGRNAFDVVMLRLITKNGLNPGDYFRFPGQHPPQPPRAPDPPPPPPADPDGDYNAGLDDDDRDWRAANRAA